MSHSKDTDFTAQHHQDADGNPAGGYAYAKGISIVWQQGPLEGREQNGAFVETLLGICRDRIHYFQSTKFACAENEATMEAIDQAIAHMKARTADRQHRGVEGTHTV